MVEELNLINPVNGQARHAIYQFAKKPRAAMVIIHGFGEHCGRYEHMMAQMAIKGISTLALDLEGHGRMAGNKRVDSDKASATSLCITS